MDYSLWGHRDLDTTERLTVNTPTKASTECQRRGHTALPVGYSA